MDVATLAMRRPPARPAQPTTPPVSNTRLAMVVVIAAEAMLFTGLVGAYIVFRLAAPSWPPPDLPRLPLGVTGVNTLILLASAVPMTRALRAARRADRAGVQQALRLTTLLGVIFLAVQGAEWARLVHHGLTLSSSMYGATFYVLVGCHGVHLLIAVLWLTVMALLTGRGPFTAGRATVLEMCAIYWYFVCGLWMLLFPLVYLY